MRARTYVFAPLCVALSACSAKQSARLTDAAETAAILAPLIPKSAPDHPMCIVMQMRPPLEDTRRGFLADEPASPWERIRVRLSRLIGASQGNQLKTDWWVPSDTQKGLKLRAEDERHLNALLMEGVSAKLPSTRRGLSPRDDIARCGEAEADPKLPFAVKVARVSFSQPVIVGNIAFVENGVVCGELCGTGGLTALIKKKGSWQILAQRMTWIA